MVDRVGLKINGDIITVSTGTSVAAAMALANARCRTSINGEPRGPLCGMGICFECRAMVNGYTHTRTCQLECVDGMDIYTDV